jgi:uncharacterized protein YyaL (SSP411 family)
MRSITLLLLIVVIADGGLGCADEAAVAPVGGALTWLPWSSDIFTRAKAEHRLVLLDLEAVWCHWCHVMDETTYQDAQVTALLRDHFLVVRVDQDSRPDLSTRYEDYGWPATILYDDSGRELAKRSGYIEPRRMASMLQAFIDDPTPGPSVVAAAPMVPERTGVLERARREQLEAAFDQSYDPDQGAWGSTHKYLNADCLEYSLLRAQGGDRQAMDRAVRSLDAARALFDPVWGGVYQYSTSGVWSEPHFEKIMSFQADYLRSYAQAYALNGDPTRLQAGQEVRRFLTGFLTAPDGAFYVSQDADLVPGEHSAEYFAMDDRARRAQGIPRVDQHIYARENGWAIEALALLHGVTGERAPLEEASRAARWIIAHRGLPGGGYSHGEAGGAGPYLGDTLAMARAELALYTATGDRSWLALARAGLDFIEARFTPAAGSAEALAGYLSVAEIPGGLPPTPSRDENQALARTANLIFHHSGEAAYYTMAQRAARYLFAAGVAERRPTAGVLLADAELGSDPLHLTVVGAKDDARAQALFRAASADPWMYKRVEWLDRREGPLPNADVQLPDLAVPALFLCTGSRCSTPVTRPEDVRTRIDHALGRAPRP